MKQTNNTYEVLKFLQASIENNTKIELVINKCFGGFGLSRKAYKELSLEGEDDFERKYTYGDRANPKLVKVVKKLGEEANGSCAELEIVKVSINDLLNEYLTNHDGREKIEGYHGEYSSKPLLEMI